MGTQADLLIEKSSVATQTVPLQQREAQKGGWGRQQDSKRGKEATEKNTLRNQGKYCGKALQTQAWEREA